MSIDGMLWNSILNDAGRIGGEVRDRMADRNARLAAEAMKRQPQDAAYAQGFDDMSAQGLNYNYGGQYNPLGILGMSGLDLANAAMGGYRPPKNYGNMFAQMANNVGSGRDIYGNGYGWRPGYQFGGVNY